MLFTDFFEATNFLLITILITSIIMGFTVHKTNFCTLGGISDWINFNDSSRAKAWILSMAIAIGAVGLSEYTGLLDLSNTFPNFRSNNLIWAEYIIGGLMFGIAMTFGSGCGNKTIIRVGEGDFNSLIVLSALATTAYYMINPFPNSENTIYSIFFIDWISQLALELPHAQDIPTFLINNNILFLENIEISTLRLAVSLVISLSIIAWIMKSKLDLRNIIAGVVVGLCVLVFWLASHNVSIDVDGENYKVETYLSEWDMLYELPEDTDDDVDGLKPLNQISWRTQSYSFINPAGNTFNYALEAGKKSISLVNGNGPKYTNPSTILNMGIVAVLGVLLGSILSAIHSKTLGFKFNLSPLTIVKNILSGIGMGVGGVLALGCTIGQGVTGVSTLSLGSFIALLSIVAGSVLAQKAIYWHLMRD